MRKTWIHFWKDTLFLVCLLLALGSAGGFETGAFSLGRWIAYTVGFVLLATAPQGPECGPSFWKAHPSPAYCRVGGHLSFLQQSTGIPVAIFEDESGNPLLAQCFEQTQFTLGELLERRGGVSSCE